MAGVKIESTVIIGSKQEEQIGIAAQDGFVLIVGLDAHGRRATLQVSPDEADMMGLSMIKGGQVALGYRMQNPSKFTSAPVHQGHGVQANGGHNPVAAMLGLNKQS